MSDFIANLIGNNYWATLIMSFFPLIELKGGIVFAIGVELGSLESFGLAYAGSTIAFLLVFFLLRPILNLLKKIKWFNKFALKVEGYFDEKATETLEKQQKKGKRGMSQTLIKQIAVLIFVAIPLPMTGVWTGTAIAVFLNLKFKDAVWPVALGNLIAGGIILGLSKACVAIWGNVAILDYILYALFALALILLVVFIIKVALHKDKKEVVLEGEGAKLEVAEQPEVENGVKESVESQDKEQKEE